MNNKKNKKVKIEKKYNKKSKYELSRNNDIENTANIKKDYTDVDAKFFDSNEQKRTRNFSCNSDGNACLETQYGGSLTDMFNLLYNYFFNIKIDPIDDTTLIKNYCNISTRKDDNSCDIRLQDINKIYRYLDSLNKLGTGDYDLTKLAVRRYLELIFCCSNVWYKNEVYKDDMRNLTIIISEIPIARELARYYIGKLMQLEPDMYRTDYINVRTKYKGTNENMFKEEKRRLIKEGNKSDQMYGSRLLNYILTNNKVS